MSTTQVELSDIFVKIGDYTIFLNHIGHADPRKPWNITPHTHTMYELHCITEGKGILYTPDERFEMLPGTVCMTGPEVCHGQTSGSEGSMDEYCLRFTFSHTPCHNSDHTENLLINAIMDEPFFILRHNAAIAELVKSMLNEAIAQPIGFKTRLGFLFGELIIGLARCRASVGSKNIGEIGRDKRIEIGSKDLKSQLDAYFFTYDTPASIDTITSQLHITRRHFSRLMQKYYGMSYTEKITELRIGYAKQLLCGNMSIADIASVIGYGTTQQFIKKFRLATGMTPGEFRRNTDKQSDT